MKNTVITTKVCFRCNLDKPLAEYYKHKQMADGHLNKCKDCTKGDSDKRERALRKDPLWVEKEKERAREKYHRLAYKDKHKPTKEIKREQQDRYKNKYPEKQLAKNKSQRMKPETIGNQLHHWSYNEEHYKDVIELSVADHNTIHRYMIYDQERMMYRVAICFGLWTAGTLLDTRERSVNFYNEVLFKKK